MDPMVLMLHVRTTRRSILALSASRMEGRSNFQLECAQPTLTHTQPLDTQQVEPADLERFHSEYGTLLKTSMSTLRKRDKKREKIRAEELAKKKKRVMDEVVVSGPKRGAGRKKRKRLISTAVKLAEFKRRAAEKDAAKATSI